MVAPRRRPLPGAGFRCFVVLLLVLPAVVAGCDGGSQRSVTNAFYYWRSGVEITVTDAARLDSMDVHRLYVRFFDVQWDNAHARAMPEAAARFQTAIPERFDVVPTVFITNRVVANLARDADAREALAENIVGKIASMMKDAGITSVPEIQIDCDWTASTREPYFDLLERINAHAPDVSPRVVLSATIRLHQVKYRTEAGVPPVDRGMLMAYNVGDATLPDTLNSIVDADEIDKYLGRLGDYPLPLDAALPLFAWGAVFHYEQFAVLINNVRTSQMQSRSDFRQVGDATFLALDDAVVEGRQVYRGDVIRVEQSDLDQVRQVAESIARRLDADSIAVSFYHYDPAILNHYEREDIQGLYGSFH